MNTHMKKHNKGFNSAIAAAMAILLSLAGFGLILGNTLAAPADARIVLSAPAGVDAANTIEAGQTKNETVFNLFDAQSGDKSIATLQFTPGAIGSVKVTGVKAGITQAAFGNKTGAILTKLYQITDSRNISAYTLSRGGRVNIVKVGDKAESPIKDIVGSEPAIRWESLDEAVADVDAVTGEITAISKGAAIVVGRFTDKWGREQDVHLLVEIGIRLSEIDLWELINLINQGKDKLDKEPNPYTDESLAALEDAVHNGQGVVDNGERSEQEIKDAIDDLKDALNNLVNKPTEPGLPPGVIEGPDGNYYRPVGRPPHVYEKVDKDGNGKQPPEYVYNPGDNPGDGNDRDAEKDGDTYYVEEPENIWTPVDENGDLDEENQIWGGPDGKPGGGDDRPVSEIDGEYWVHMSQNVWRKYNPGAPKGPLGPLTGGGPDGNPATDPVTEIYDNTDKDGKYYVGPLGPDGDGNEYYYGDPKTGGNGTLDSTAAGAEKDDVKYYKDKDGNMTTAKPAKPIVDEPTVAEDGRVLKPADSGDSADWIEIARNGDYSLIVRADFINFNGNNYGNPLFQAPHFGPNSAYPGSVVRTEINDWFNGGSGGDNLGSGARLREYTVSNNAYSVLGTGSSDEGGLTDGFSKPTGYRVGAGSDVAFALSFSEAANFISREYAIVIAESMYGNSSAAAAANFGRLRPYGMTDYIWLRSPGTGATKASAMQHNGGRVFQMFAATDTGLIYPALWVHNSIFE